MPVNKRKNIVLEIVLYSNIFLPLLGRGGGRKNCLGDNATFATKGGGHEGNIQFYWVGME